ncbi:MAG: helix-turn-helix transcriptional regulator [Lachnospiraceae bacterium]|nr:helix-turn-helix transcriptional regulator [Lachnospiraceae bacterium]
MGYPIYTKSILCYIEANIMNGKFDYAMLGKSIGFSQAYIREIFRNDMGCPIAEYIRARRVKCSAMDLLNSDKTIIEIAYKYGFNNPETYTRAFYKITGMTPSKFRMGNLFARKEMIFPGVYSIGILDKKESRSDINMTKNFLEESDSTILYGVPRVFFGAYGGATPYPICLKACSEYLGDNLEYYFTMVSCGAAFRFVWNTKAWDLSNVDIYHTFEESNEVYANAAKALGREFLFLGRDENTAKEEFISFIKEHIDEGYPCIALGIIGPPEACIITGYRENGKELLGWNFFQEDSGFASGITIDESGYFVCSNWWENTDTQAVMCLGAIEKDKYTTADIIANAVKALSGRMDCGYAKGIKAYDAWKKAISDENNFSVNSNYMLLFEKMLCQNDAMSCIADGRNCASLYFKELAGADSPCRNSYLEISELFRKCSSTIVEMQNLYNGNGNASMDDMLKNLADKEIRDKTCVLIETAKKADTEALGIMEKLIHSF